MAGIGLFLGLWWLGLSPLGAWFIAWSVPAFALYGIDKRQARMGRWRVPEVVLHGLALVGGVVGAWAGRASFRHKTHEPIFLIVLIVASVIWSAIAAWALLG
jgi:uncharacterized membrane protein YsdA (DUF1294 family)